MSSIPTSLSRVPTSLGSRLALGTLARTNLALMSLNERIATQREILRPSDDIVKSATIGVLDDRLERGEQLLRNLDHARSALNVLDDVLMQAGDTATEGRALASDLVNSTYNAGDRASQSLVVEQMLRGLFDRANERGVAGFVLGGTATSQRPIEQFYGFYRYVAQDTGLTTDTGQVSSIPLTLGSNPVAGISARVRGSVDLNPQLTPTTLLRDLAGARGLGIAAGPVEFSVAGDARVRVDLTDAESVRDVAQLLERAIRNYETEAGVTVLGAGGIGVSGEALALDLAPGADLRFFEVAAGVTARDLGLTDDAGSAFTNPGGAGVIAPGRDLGVRLTADSSIDSLLALTGETLGTLRIRNAGREALVDLSDARTIQDIRNRIEEANLGVRVRINASGTGLDILNDVSAGSASALSISEVAGGNTATLLGVRTLGPDTAIRDLNFGRGVKIIDGVADPATGNVNLDLNADIRLTLGDASLSTIDIDLRPSDMTSVGNVVGVMNQQIQTRLAALGLPADTLEVGLASDGNGIVLRQSPALTGAVQVSARNNSGAAEDLGLLKGNWNPATGVYAGEDRGLVRVDSLFSALIDLREGLRTNDVRGISFAGEDLDKVGDAIAEVRGVIGGYGERVDIAMERETDKATLDEATRSQLRDLDFPAAASRLALLQTQLEATLRATSQTQRLSLIDFL